MIGALPCAGWETVIVGAGLVGVELANPVHVRLLDLGPQAGLTQGGASAGE